jgi:hypothetical protein
MQRRVLLILTQSCWPLIREYSFNEGWLGTVCATTVQCCRWGSVSLTPQPCEETPNGRGIEPTPTMVPAKGKQPESHWCKPFAPPLYWSICDIKIRKCVCFHAASYIMSKVMDKVKFRKTLKAGDLNGLRRFFDAGVSIYQEDDDTPSPMAYALETSNVKLVRLLLERGCDVNRTPFRSGKRTPVMAALKCRPILDLLVAAGADLNAADEYGYTVAHYAAAGSHLEVLTRLHPLGLALHVETPTGETPFSQATRYGQFGCAAFLLERGADINHRDSGQMTPLMVAAQKGLVEACQWLLSKGADLHAMDGGGRTALDWARANNHTAAFAFLEEAHRRTPPPTAVPQKADTEGASRGILLRLVLRALVKVCGWLETRGKTPAKDSPPADSQARTPPVSTKPDNVPRPVSKKTPVTASGRFARASCWCGKRMRLPTDQGGTLELEGGEFIPCEFSFGVKASGEEVDFLCLIVRLVDLQGQAWEAQSVWSPAWFVERLTDFDQISQPVLFDDTGTDYLEALEDRWFVRGARALLDDRFYRTLSLAGRRYIVPFKYQVPRLDVAFELEASEAQNAGRAEVLVKLSGLYAHESESSSEPISVPDVMFTVDIGKRLFMSGLYEEEEGAWSEQDVPELVTFKRTGTSGTPNPHVRFVSG